MPDPIDTDAVMDGAEYAHWSYEVLRDLCNEVDCLRAAIAAIPRHAPASAPRGAYLGQWTGVCGNCRIVWPCPTEQAHRLIAAVQTTDGLSDGDHAAGPNTDGSCGEGPHDAIGRPSGGTAEGNLPAAKDDTP